LVVLESLVLHAVALPSFSDGYSHSSEYMKMISTHAPQMVRDWILAKMDERGLRRERGERGDNPDWRSESSALPSHSLSLHAVDRNAASGGKNNAFQGRDGDGDGDRPGFACATLLCALFLSGSGCSSSAVGSAASGGQKVKSARKQRAPCDKDKDKDKVHDCTVETAARAASENAIGRCGAHVECKDGGSGSGSGSGSVPLHEVVSPCPRLVNVLVPPAGFEFLASLTFSHCKWGWTIESLLLFAYLLNVSRVSEPDSEAVRTGTGTGTGTSSDVSSNSEKRCGHLSRLRVINIEGSDLFEPSAGFAALSKADKGKLRETCAVFQSICKVKLVIDGISDDN
jgi:hypothetical protein